MNDDKDRLYTKQMISSSNNHTNGLLPMMHLLPSYPECPRDARTQSFILILDDMESSSSESKPKRREGEDDDGKDDIMVSEMMLVNLDKMMDLPGSKKEMIKKEVEEEDEGLDDPWWYIIETVSSSSPHPTKTKKKKNPSTELCFLNEKEGDDFVVIKKNDLHEWMTKDIEQYTSQTYRTWCHSVPLSILDTYYRQSNMVQSSVSSSISGLSRQVFVHRYPILKSMVSGYHTVIYLKGLWTLYQTLQTIRSNPIPFPFPSSSSSSIPFSGQTISVYLVSHLPSIITFISTVVSLV